MNKIIVYMLMIICIVNIMTINNLKKKDIDRIYVLFKTHEHDSAQVSMCTIKSEDSILGERCPEGYEIVYDDYLRIMGFINYE